MQLGLAGLATTAARLPLPYEHKVHGYGLSLEPDACILTAKPSSKLVHWGMC